MEDIKSIIITVYDKKDLDKSNEALSEAEQLELKELLDSIDWDEVFKPQPFKKPRVLHNYRYIKDGEVEHWTTELK